MGIWRKATMDIDVVGRAVKSILADAFNTAYGVTEIRRGWKKLVLSLASGPIIALA